ncbi:hypothetical protein J7J18_06920 [bacterium]|nr:hypothetical protein [bacterium]
MVSTQLNEILDGLIFSDGHIAYCKAGDYRFELGTTKRLYAEQVCNLLRPVISCSIREQVRIGFGKKFISYRVVGYKAPVMKNLHYRWYDDKKKKLPKDFRWTPTTLNVAYCGDGTVIENSPTMCLNSWAVPEVKEIVRCFEELGLYGTVVQTPTGPIFRLHQDCALDFFEYIGDPLIPFHSYKWITVVNPQQAVRATLWDDDLAQKVARCIKKIMILRVWGGSKERRYLSYFPELVVMVNDKDVKDALQRIRTSRKKGEVVVRGRQAKRVLERVHLFLPDDKRMLATIALALPLGRRKKDLKEVLYQFFWTKFNELNPPERRRGPKRELNSELRLQRLSVEDTNLFQDLVSVYDSPTPTVT